MRQRAPRGNSNGQYAMSGRWLAGAGRRPVALRRGGALEERDQVVELQRGRDIVYVPIAFGRRQVHRTAKISQRGTLLAGPRHCGQTLTGAPRVACGRPL